MEPTGKGLNEFWAYAASKGLMNDATAQTMRAACKGVLSSVEPESWEGLNLHELDVDQYCQRFERLRMGDFKPESLHIYQKRFRNGLQTYLEFLENPSTWQYPSSRSAASSSDGKPKPKPKRRKSDPSQSNGSRSDEGYESGDVDMIDYPYPLRQGLVVRLKLPTDLTHREAERLGAFLKSLAFEAPKELPSASAPVTQEAG